jgi:hypothetical protein
MTLKSLKDLRKLSFNLTSSRLAFTTVGNLPHWIVTNKVDFDIQLKEGINLQRPFVWDLRQKQELILSILYNRPIPSLVMATLSVGKDSAFNGPTCIIDGKQRLGALLEFAKGKFGVPLEGKEYTLQELQTANKEYYLAISKFHIEATFAYDLTKEQMLEWFLRINFSGTPQGTEHLDLLKTLN